MDSREKPPAHSSPAATFLPSAQADTTLVKIFLWDGSELKNENEKSKILIIGYGNPYRQDDSIGHVIAKAVEKWAAEIKINFLTVMTAYQLELEMVEDLANNHTVIFIDAHTPDYSDNLVFEKVEPKVTKGFTTHVFGPGDLVGLSMKFYNHAPEAYILSVPGYDFDMGNDLSGKTLELSEKAIALLKEKLLDNK